MHKYNGKYYLSYSGEKKIQYCMSDSPFGPFEYKGVILDRVNTITNHHSITNYKGKWYMFYHNADLYYQNSPKAKEQKSTRRLATFRRSICVDELFYNSDGTIKKVIQTKEGVPLVK